MKKNYYLFFAVLFCLTSFMYGQNWTVYDASVLPNAFDPAFSTSSGSFRDTENIIKADPDNAANSLLQMEVWGNPVPADPAPQTSFLWRMNFANHSIDVTNLTVVMRVKGHAARNMAMDIDMHYNDIRSRVSIHTADSLADIRNGSGTDVTLDVDVTDWNIYRFTMTATETNLYINESTTPALTFTPAAAVSTNRHFRFGDGDSGKDFGADIDWVAWDVTGAYAPGEGTNPPVNIPEDINIIFVEAGEREPVQEAFLKAQGFNVEVFNPGPLAAAGQDTLDKLNEADLIVIGRSCPSSQYRGNDATAWKAITTPVILNAQYIATGGNARINWFQASKAFHANTEPKMAYARVADPTNPIFSFVTVGDSIPWCYAPHDFLEVGDTATYGNIAAKWLDKNVLIVQNEADSALYKGGPKAAGPRTYFGFGNDNVGYDNFFPITKEAQQVYFNEICRLTGVAMREVESVESTRPAAKVIFVEAGEKEPEQEAFLKAQGYDVEVFDPGALSAAGQDTIDKLNAADLIVIGRSCPSSQYRGNDATAWKAITTPVILNAQYIATGGPQRINWFEASKAFHANTEPELAYARVADPSDPIFSFVTIGAGDSIPWCMAPHDFLEVGDTATYGNIAAKWLGNNVLIVQNEADSALYKGGPKAAGPRTYFGFGNDNVGFNNFFPLTNEAQQVYYNEMQRLLGRSMKEVVPVYPSESPANIILVQVDDRDQRQFEFLKANGFNVETFNPGPLAAAGQDTIDRLNNADLVIIGRSPMSSGYRDVNATAWMSITSPVILNSQYIATGGPQRINWFSASKADHYNTEPETAYARVTNDTIFTFVQYTDSIPWCLAPHDFLAVHDSATYGDIAATWLGTNALIVQNEADSTLYPGGPKAAGPRTYFGFGNDNVGFDNFFPLTDEAQQVYYNEIRRLLDRPMKEVVTVEPTKAPVTPVTYTVTVAANPAEGGSVAGGGTFEEGTDVTLTATTNAGFDFVNWTDAGGAVLGTDTAYTFKVGTADVTITANFTPEIGIKTYADQNIQLYPNPATSMVYFKGIETGSTVRVMNTVGQLVNTYENVNNSIDISSLEQGVYFLQIETSGTIVGKARLIKK
jgi:hypothetical protein